MSTNSNSSTSSSTSSLRIPINYHQFGQSPISSIKQILGQNTQVISYKLNSVVNWDGTVVVDVEYQHIPVNPFTIYYVPITEIKHLIPNSEKYVCEVNGCRVKLNNPKLNAFKDYLPIKIRKTMLNQNDNYDNLYNVVEELRDSGISDVSNMSNNNSNTNGNTNTNASSLHYSLKTNTTHTPIMYFGTTVIQPMNALCTPLTLLQHDLENLTSNYSVGFNLPMPDKLYNKDFKPTIISESENMKQYKQCLVNAQLLKQVEDVVDMTKEKNQKELNDMFSSTTSTIAYLISVSQLPNTSISGVILLQPKRIPDVMLYYPTNAYTISEDEIESIKKFVEFDYINYMNYQWLKKSK